jgi:hypothetical protein
MMEAYRKKIDMSISNSEKLLNVENPTRLINFLAEKYFSGNIIILDEANRNAITTASKKLGKSSEEVVNQIISSMEIEVKEAKKKKKIKLGSNPPVQRKNYVLDI